MSFLDGYDGGEGGPIEVLRRALMGDNAPMLAKTQQMEAQDIVNQFRDRLPEFPADAQPVPGPAYRGVRVASADPSFMPEMPSMGGPGAADASFSPPDPARMSPLQLAIAGGNGDMAGLTAGPRQATTPAVPQPGPGATVDQNGSTQAIPAPSPAPARAAAVSGFPERNLSVPVGPGVGASPPVNGLLGNLIPRDTLAAIAKGLSGIQGRGPLAAFARGAGSAYTGRQEQATTNAEKARKQSMEEREQRRKEGDSASLRSYRARGAAGGEDGTDDATLFGKGKRSILDAISRVRKSQLDMDAAHSKARLEDRRALESGLITKEEAAQREAQRQEREKSFIEGEGRILNRPLPGLPGAAQKAAPAAAAAKKPAAALPSDRSTLKDGSEYTLKDGRVGRWNAKTKMMDIVGE